jgi:hypothetical protein
MPWLNPNDVPQIPRTIVPAHSDTGRNVLGVNPAYRGAASPDVMNWQKPGADRDPNKPADMIEPRHGFTRTVLGGYFQDSSFNIHVPVFNKSASTSSLREAKAKNPYEMQQQLEGSQSARKMTRYESRGAIRPVASPQPTSSRPTSASARPRPATAGFPHEAGIPRVLTPNGGTRNKTIEYIPPPTPGQLLAVQGSSFGASGDGDGEQSIAQDRDIANMVPSSSARAHSLSMFSACSCCYLSTARVLSVSRALLAGVLLLLRRQV